MNRNQAIEIANKVISNATFAYSDKQSKTKKVRKVPLNPVFREIYDDEFWSMGHDKLDQMQDDFDIDCQVSQHCN